MKDIEIYLYTKKKTNKKLMNTKFVWVWSNFEARLGFSLDLHNIGPGLVPDWVKFKTKTSSNPTQHLT